jgi:plasmid stabilization system protein ParE
MGRYFLSSVAEADTVAIWEYIAADSLHAADRMVDSFTTAFERIAKFPEAGARYDHPKCELRFVVVAPYLVFYKITADEVDIVLHSARKWDELL